MKKFNLLPTIINKKIVVISPHADDIAVGCGGTMALLSATNTIFPLLFFTGERGVIANTKEERITIREREMTDEARILGLHNPTFLRLASYESQSRKTQQQDSVLITQELKKLKPDIIFLPHKLDVQPRHRLATKLTLQALKHSTLEPDLFFYETAWHPFGPLDFNIGFSFNESIMAQKLAAIRAHQSQLQRTRFDIAALSLAQLRAATVPEQRIGGYGYTMNQPPFEYLEVFLTRKIKKRS